MWEYLVSSVINIKSSALTYVKCHETTSEMKWHDINKTELNSIFCGSLLVDPVECFAHRKIQILASNDYKSAITEKIILADSI